MITLRHQQTLKDTTRISQRRRNGMRAEQPAAPGWCAAPFPSARGLVALMTGRTTGTGITHKNL
ncbi:hypothetical protein ATR01nite_02240 [Acetobacter tropicalis]|uniref:Uncharacterized protein n=1 Tax=Acetobacter tropicalis TaxID=104102 RepID=A0A511FIT3_9PROT|nr:hypothetical protein ATR01nite_02240 [Acetobacter tropicalis]